MALTRVIVALFGVLALAFAQMSRGTDCTWYCENTLMSELCSGSGSLGLGGCMCTPLHLPYFKECHQTCIDQGGVQGETFDFICGVTDNAPRDISSNDPFESVSWGGEMAPPTAPFGPNGGLPRFTRDNEVIDAPAPTLSPRQAEGAWTQTLTGPGGVVFTMTHFGMGFCGPPGSACVGGWTDEDEPADEVPAVTTTEEAPATTLAPRQAEGAWTQTLAGPGGVVFTMTHFGMGFCGPPGSACVGGKIVEDDGVQPQPASVPTGSVPTGQSSVHDPSVPRVFPTVLPTKRDYAPDGPLPLRRTDTLIQDNVAVPNAISIPWKSALAVIGVFGGLIFVV